MVPHQRTRLTSPGPVGVASPDLAQSGPEEPGDSREGSLKTIISEYEIRNSDTNVLPHNTEMLSSDAWVMVVILYQFPINIIIISDHDSSRLILKVLDYFSSLFKTTNVTSRLILKVLDYFSSLFKTSFETDHLG
jgi:hypothetical protein